MFESDIKKCVRKLRKNTKNGGKLSALIYYLVADI